MKKPIACSIALLLAVPLNQVFAYEGVFEEVVVTARKREETSQSVPIPVTAVSAEVMDQRNIIDVSDLEKLSPNTSIRKSATDSSSAVIFMRGIGQSNTSATQDPKIGIYIDGVYLSRPQGGLFDLWDVQRVEVLRGPQGTLFGRNTTAGLIQVVNNQPTFERELNVQGGAGTDGHHTLGLTANLPVNDKLAFRLSAFDKETDGFVENILTGNDRGNENSTSIRAAGLWETENFSANLSFSRFDADERGALGQCTFTGPLNPFEQTGLGSVGVIFGIYDDWIDNCNSTTDEISIDTAEDESTTSEVDAWNLTMSYDLGWGVIDSITSYRDTESFNGSWGWVAGNGPGANFLEILNRDGEYEAWSQELRLSGSTDRLEWVVGAYFFEEESYTTTDVPLFRGVTAPSPAEWPFFYAPTGATNRDGSPQTFGDIALSAQRFRSRHQEFDVTNANHAVFAELTYALTEKLDLTVGARYTKDEREFTRIQTLFDGSFDPAYFCPGMPTVSPSPGVTLPASDRCTQEVDYDETTPRIILSYDAAETIMLYASYSVGYSSGGFNQDVRMRPFLPEQSDNFEAGLKSILLDGRWKLNTTFFHNTYENQQLTVSRVVDGQPTADLVNAQEATLKGVEFESQFFLTDNLIFAATGGFIRGDYDEFTVQDNFLNPVTLMETVIERDLRDTEFGSGDTTTFDASLNHSWDLENGGSVVSSIGYTYRDRVYYSLQNTPSSLAPSYWLSDLSITWNMANDKTSLTLWGTNIFDEDYVDTMINQAGDVEIGGVNPGLGFSTRYWGDPARFGLILRHSL